MGDVSRNSNLSIAVCDKKRPDAKIAADDAFSWQIKAGCGTGFSLSMSEG